MIFVIGAVIILSKSDPGAPVEPLPGGFWIALGATFGFAAGWNPYASDYTRYLPPGTGRVAGIFAGAGLFASCVLLETVGAAAVTAVGGANWNPDNPVSSFTGLLPEWLEQLTLLAICLGAIAANALNIYSSSLSFTAMGVRLPTRSSRAVMAIVMGTAGFVVAAIGLDNIESYEAFLLVIAYWIGPWLGVVFADRILRRLRPDETVTADRRYRNWAGFVAMLVAGVVSVWLFSNQAKYVGMGADGPAGNRRPDVRGRFLAGGRALRGAAPITRRSDHDRAGSAGGCPGSDPGRPHGALSTPWAAERLRCLVGNGVNSEYPGKSP